MTMALVCVLSPLLTRAQFTEKISENVTLSVNTNIETYFLAEKLAVEHIGNYVYSYNNVVFSHQPIVYYGLQEFMPWKDKPVILRIADILKQLRDQFHDNAPQLEYLLYRNQFPASGLRWPVPADLPVFDEEHHHEAKRLVLELADSLSSFYHQAKVGEFLQRNAFFYKGALAEAKKHINVKAIPYMEKWYGQKFAGYELYLMLGMPITPGEDNYRAFGPMLTSPKGKVSAMVFSSSVQLPLLPALKDYKAYGFDNKEVTQFLTVHEIGHSFVNPIVKSFPAEIIKDSALFTPALAKTLENSYIGSWETCVIEHLVRLGEIRVTKMVGDKTEVNRLRKLHIDEFHFVLLPLLEKKIAAYESNRSKYPDFKSFLPELFQTLHQLKPTDIDALLKKKMPSAN
ncbi:DUF4932 domain-containing protein [Adhaeribacter swui]|uniref:DUF4932 domain-containing protein n=1 Tax=Adhaeribacter swui TaxID=2086471 RepID=A0A7G7GB95_9BACT|nr:DUF4932 domain-containing protein [Adhaeribacter swui]QNF34429.1 DUF4932 domain-containing protein [Adhaeribacter swui]